MPEESPGTMALLSALRRAAGLTQEELAERSGLSTRGISSIECGRVARPHRRSLEAIAEALNLGADDRERFIHHYRRYPDEPTVTVVDDIGEHTGKNRPDPGPSDIYPPAQLPPATAGFVGRESQLDRLRALLPEPGAAATPAMTIATIDGAAGIGKTALALHWAHRVRDRFPDGQLYANLRGYGPTPPADPGIVLARFLVALGVPAGQVPAEIEARSGLFRSWLADRRVLLVLDNARTVDQVRPLLPAGTGCAVLVTSRNRLPGLCVREGAHRISLGQMDNAEAKALLGRFVDAAQLATEAKATGRILEQCAGLPLALSLVGDLASSGRTLSELATELADHRTRLEVLATTDDEGDEPVGVRAVFSWSYRALAHPAASTFRLLALHPGPDLSLPAAAALIGHPVRQTRALLTTLSSGHLLERRGADRYEFHDLLRVYALDLCGRHDPEPVRRAALTRLLDHYLHTAIAAATTLDPHDDGLAAVLADTPDGGVGDRFTDLSGALAWLDTERANLVAAAGYAAGHGMAGYTGKLSDVLWRYLHQTACHDDALTVHSTALTVARGIGDRTREARALLHLGTANHRLGRNRTATGQLEQAIAIAEEFDDDIANARAHNYLGMVRTSVGDLLGAVRAHERALELYRRAGHHEGEGQSMNNLGLVCWRLDRCTDALRHFEQARRITRRIGDRATEAGTTNNIGLILRRLGRHEAALRHFQEALAVAREIEHREGEGFATSNIGSAYMFLGRYDTAREHQLAALRIARSTGMRGLEATVLNRLGRIAHLTGDHALAGTCHTGALRVSEQIGARYEQAVALEGLGNLHHAVRDDAAARRCWEQALSEYTALGLPEVADLRRRITALDRPPTT